MKRVHLVGPVLVLALVLLAGCMRIQTLVVTPFSGTAEAGETVAFAAADQLGNPIVVTWAVDAGPGTISVGNVGPALRR